MFSVTVSKGSEGGEEWSQYRSDNASCVVSTSVVDMPLASIIPKVSVVPLLLTSKWHVVCVGAYRIRIQTVDPAKG